MENLFGSKKEDKKKTDSAASESEFDLSKIYVWIRGIESKVNNIRRELDIIKQNTSNKDDKIKKEIKTIRDDLIELKRERETINQKMDLMVKELKITAGKEELMVLKKYIDYWNPMNFVTQRDVERVVEEKMGERMMKTEKT